MQGGDEVYNSIEEKEELRQNLKDAGLDDDSIEQFLCLYQSNRSSICMRSLKNHRSQLLTEIRIRQEKLFCLDYLIRKLSLKERL